MNSSMARGEEEQKPKKNKDKNKKDKKDKKVQVFLLAAGTLWLLPLIF